MKRLKTYDDFLAEAAGHRFGCAMLTFDLPVLGQLRAAIDEDDLHVWLRLEPELARVLRVDVTVLATGNNGTEGRTGATGPTGPGGATGNNGTNGVTGPTGPTGTATLPGGTGVVTVNDGAGSTATFQQGTGTPYTGTIGFTAGAAPSGDDRERRGYRLSEDLQHGQYTANVFLRISRLGCNRGTRRLNRRDDHPECYLYRGVRRHSAAHQLRKTGWCIVSPANRSTGSNGFHRINWLNGVDWLNGFHRIDWFNRSDRARTRWHRYGDRQRRGISHGQLRIRAGDHIRRWSILHGGGRAIRCDQLQAIPLPGR